MFPRLSATFTPACAAATATAKAWRVALFTCRRHASCEEGKPHQPRRRRAPKMVSPPRAAAAAAAAAAAPSSPSMMKLPPTTSPPPPPLPPPPLPVKRSTRAKKDEEVNGREKIALSAKKKNKTEKVLGKVGDRVLLRPLEEAGKRKGQGGVKVARGRQTASHHTSADDEEVTSGMRSPPITNTLAPDHAADSMRPIDDDDDDNKLVNNRHDAVDLDDDDDDNIVDEESKHFMQILQEEVVQREYQKVREQPDLAFDGDDGDDAYLAQLEGTGHHAGAEKSVSANVRKGHVSVGKATQTNAMTNGEDRDVENAMSTLNEDQRRAVKLAREGHNLFITGGAGTGKSLVIREIVRQLRQEEKRTVFVTATTGVAALNVRGSTINSFAGVKFGDGEVRELLKWVRRNRRASGRWKHCQTLIIDEVSMMDPELLGKLDYIARAIRRCGSEPFGGIQVVLCGDFLQLPPIRQNRHRWTQPQEEEAAQQQQQEEVVTMEAGKSKNAGVVPGQRKMVYCFEGDAWKALGLKSVVLRQKFRQHHDASFQRVLDEVRFGVLSAHTQELLASRTVNSHVSLRKRHAVVDASLEANATTDAKIDEEQERHVRLCATNKEVESRNAKYFAALEPCEDDDLAIQMALFTSSSRSQDEGIAGVNYNNVNLNTTHPIQVYRAYDECNEDDGSPLSIKFEDSTLPTELSLKVGTRVMLLQNISLRLGLVNGSVGEVVGFMHPLELVELVLRAPRERHCASARGQELLQRGGFPTISHAFRCVDTALGQSLFWSLRQRGIRQTSEASYGGVYGNAHCRNVERLVGLSRQASTVHPLEMYLGGMTPLQLRLTRLPVVKLDLQPQHPTLGINKCGGTKLPQQVYAFVSPSSHQWYMGDQVMATRTQLPLRQAWAITVHKAQGLTISHIEVSMHRFFSPGQAYVALSRSTCLENIRLLGFRDGSIRACPIAKKFYTTLENNEEWEEEEEDEM